MEKGANVIAIAPPGLYGEETPAGTAFFACISYALLRLLNWSWLSIVICFGVLSCWRLHLLVSHGFSVVSLTPFIMSLAVWSTALLCWDLWETHCGRVCLCWKKCIVGSDVERNSSVRWRVYWLRLENKQDQLRMSCMRCLTTIGSPWISSAVLSQGWALS